MDTIFQSISSDGVWFWFELVWMWSKSTVANDVSFVTCLKRRAHVNTPCPTKKWDTRKSNHLRDTYLKWGDLVFMEEKQPWSPSKGLGSSYIPRCGILAVMELNHLGLGQHSFPNVLKWPHVLFIRFSTSPKRLIKQSRNRELKQGPTEGRFGPMSALQFWRKFHH